MIVGIVFATKMEAEPFFAKTDSKQISERPFPLFKAPVPGHNTPCFLVICGMGKIMAALATQLLIREHQATMVVNAGVCGALTEGIETGSVFRIMETWEADADKTAGKVLRVVSPEKAWGSLKGARLATNDSPLFDIERRKKLARHAELVDMEGAAVARTAAMYGVPCSLIKGVTDFADQDSREALHRNLKEVSQKIASILIEGMPEK